MGDELKRVRMRVKKMDQSTNNCTTVFMVPKYKVQKIKEVNKEKIRKMECKKVVEKKVKINIKKDYYQDCK